MLSGRGEFPAWCLRCKVRWGYSGPGGRILKFICAKLPCGAGTRGRHTGQAVALELGALAQYCNSAGLILFGYG